MKHDLDSRHLYAFLALVPLVAVGLLAGGPASAQTVMDLTGETCLDGSVELDTDGDGTLDSTYCLMQGRLPSGTALEMDDLDGGDPVSGDPTTVEDANVFSSDLPNDPDLPFIPGAVYIDWDDLDIGDVMESTLGTVENNRILDFVANDDFTMLKPQAKSCLNDGSVLPKEDFTQSYIANNDEYLYFAQERRTNNGNSVYYWLLTQEPPVVVDHPDCSNARGQLQFTLTPGDIELLVNFPDSSDPASGAVFFREYEGMAQSGIPARQAVFDPGWPEPTLFGPVKNFALNINTDSDDEGLPHWGGLSRQGNPIPQDGNEYTTASFAEWAVDLSELFEGGPICGQRLFITGLSRASTGQVGSIDESAALKDTVGPKLYSFGEITAFAEMTGSCDLTFTYSATAVGIDGVTPIPEEELDCLWDCTSADGRTITYDPTVCSGSGSIPSGDGSPDTISCTVSVTEFASGCEDTAEAQADVLAPIIVTIGPDPNQLTCTIPAAPGADPGNVGAGVTYTAMVSGGDGNYSYSWTVSGPNAATCGNSSMCVVDIPDSDFCARTELSVTVDDTEPLCEAATSEVETVTKFTQVDATNN